MSSEDGAQHANDAPFDRAAGGGEGAPPSDASGGLGVNAEDVTVQTRTARPTLRGDAATSSLLAGASSARALEREDGTKDYWRQLRSRSVCASSR